ncbi:hypothetical protein L6V77_35535, partial [Myxococcota bacterium]|nr:hypothetical protein [Myxococcota bacterium]
FFEGRESAKMLIRLGIAVYAGDPHPKPNDNIKSQGVRMYHTLATKVLTCLVAIFAFSSEAQTLAPTPAGRPLAPPFKDASFGPPANWQADPIDVMCSTNPGEIDTNQVEPFLAGRDFDPWDLVLQPTSPHSCRMNAVMFIGIRAKGGDEIHLLDYLQAVLAARPSFDGYHVIRQVIRAIGVFANRTAASETRNLLLERLKDFSRPNFWRGSVQKWETALKIRGLPHSLAHLSILTIGAVGSQAACSWLLNFLETEASEIEAENVTRDAVGYCDRVRAGRVRGLLGTSDNRP